MPFLPCWIAFTAELWLYRWMAPVTTESRACAQSIWSHHRAHALHEQLVTLTLRVFKRLMLCKPST